MKYFALAVMLATVFVGSGLGQTPQSLSGTWTPSLSHPVQGPRQTISIEISVSGQSVTIIETRLYASGKLSTSTEKFQSDGREHPVGSGRTFIARWIGSHSLETVLRNADKLIGRVVYEVQPDGNTLTVVRTGLYEEAVVFVRE